MHSGQFITVHLGCPLDTGKSVWICWRIASKKLSCGHVCGHCLDWWLMGKGVSALWEAPSLAQVSLDCTLRTFPLDGLFLGGVWVLYWVCHDWALCHGLSQQQKPNQNTSESQLCRFCCLCVIILYHLFASKILRILWVLTMFLFSYNYLICFALEFSLVTFLVLE